eukprot:TRINITY_DN7928_c0_g1_i1.p2 TRINITY_DN7928_c0_g1~~TRINITY_DN7928_c0_g1_i1.p2  ORF type:complete len:147 (-),score=28.39 TRINITY_DN7928_c0_g1_i1:1170-1610(-)
MQGLLAALAPISRMIRPQGLRAALWDQPGCTVVIPRASLFVDQIRERTTQAMRRDNERRQLFKKWEPRRRILKAIRDNETLDSITRTKAMFALQQIPRDSSITRVHNRCVVTGRPRGVYSFFKMSRHKLREAVRDNELPGVQKSSW